MSRRLFVGSLSFSATTADLRDLFGQCGQVADAVIVVDRITGRSRGFGFVEMGSRKEGIQALGRLQGAELKGRPIRLTPATPRPERLSREERALEGEFSTWNQVG